MRRLYGMLAQNPEVAGGSCVAAPNRLKLACAGWGEALLIVDLHPPMIGPPMIGHCAATFPYRAERRPDLYALLFGET